MCPCCLPRQVSPEAGVPSFRGERPRVSLWSHSVRREAGGCADECRNTGSFPDGLWDTVHTSPRCVSPGPLRGSPSAMGALAMESAVLETFQLPAHPTPSQGKRTPVHRKDQPRWPGTGGALWREWRAEGQAAGDARDSRGPRSSSDGSLGRCLVHAAFSASGAPPNPDGQDLPQGGMSPSPAERPSAPMA